MEGGWLMESTMGARKEEKRWVRGRMGGAGCVTGNLYEDQTTLNIEAYNQFFECLTYEIMVYEFHCK